MHLSCGGDLQYESENCGETFAHVCRTYNAALSALLHFHDCMVPASTAQRAVYSAATPPQLPQESRSRPLQQALLSLSQLHIDHGHVDAATTALLEAVDVDQGSGDTHAMVMCLMQLCVIMNATTPDCTGESNSPASLMQVLFSIALKRVPHIAVQW